jgi:hypothetical protein
MTKGLGNRPAEIFGLSISSEKQSTIEGRSRVLEEIALHYFGDICNLVSFSGVTLPGAGRVDYVLARHKLMKTEMDDFVLVDFQNDFSDEIEQTILNKSIIYKAWNVKGYWVIPEYIFGNLVKRFSFGISDYDPTHTCRFAAHDFTTQDDCLTFTLSRYVSAAIDELYHLHNTPDLPNKDKFVKNLSTRLQSELLGDLVKLTRSLNDHQNRLSPTQI